MNHKGGLAVVAQVGACQRQDCLHNQELECPAPSTHVGRSSDHADCLSYQSR